MRAWNAAIAALFTTSSAERIALLLSGAVSREGGNFVDKLPGSGGEYSDIEFCASTIKQHFIEANTDVNTIWDVLIHSWNPDLRERFESLYDFAAAEFEDNEPYPARLANVYASGPNAPAWTREPEEQHFGALSHSVSHAKVAALALVHEKVSGVRYDRFVLTRPDLLLFRDLPLTRLSRKLGEAYCNSHGGAGGDFHFVLERWHVEAVAANLDNIIALAANPPLEHPKPYLTSGHGMMRAFLDHALGPAAACDPAVRDARCRGVLSIDLVIFAGFDQEVYRKTPFHLLLLCPKAPVRQAVLAYLVATYGLSAESTAMLERKAKRMGCKGTTALSKADVFSALNFCCLQGNHTYDGTFGEPSSVCRTWEPRTPNQCPGRHFSR